MVFERAKLVLYESIARLRPEQLGVLAKAALRVSRRAVRDESGCLFWVDPITPLGLAVMRDGTYEPQMKQLVRGVLRENDTFIDLGANEGYFSVIAAAAAPEGRVLSIEPQPSMRTVLLENARINNARHMEVSSIAVSNKNGQASLFLRSSINQGASRLESGFPLGFGSETVQTMTLADFCAVNRVERARLLKMDCEGAELKVVGGSPNVFERQMFDVIALELHPSIIGAEGCRTIHAQLTSAGYKLAQWNGQTIYYLDRMSDTLAALDPALRLDAPL